MPPKNKHKEWVMPAWMEPYRHEICNTGGNSVEECVESKATCFENAPMALIACSVKAQVTLLNILHKKGKLP